MQLSRLTNLGALTIGKGFKGPDIGLDDSVVRTWMRAVFESNAFQMLRVLNCRSQREITGTSFGYLARFPCLAIINFEDCSVSELNKSEASHWGWSYKAGKDLSNFLVDAGTTDSTWNSVIHTCFRRGASLSIKELATEDVKAINSTPVLHFSLGASPPDAAINVAGRQAMKSFQRLTPCPTAVEVFKAPKRPTADKSHWSGPVRQKPKMRASKQQNMGLLLTGFGS